MYGLHTKLVVSSLVALLGASFISTAQAGEPKRCKGQKTWYAGQCRYPEEIDKLKAQRRGAAEARRQADQQRCDQARLAGSASTWRAYLQSYPNGICLAEAEAAITALERTPQPSTAPAPAPSPTTPATPSPSPAAPPPPPRETGGISPLVWIGFGVGAVGLITWGITGGLSLSQSSELKDACPDNLCDADRQDDIDGATTLAHVATAGFAVGLAGVAVGVVGLFLSGDDDDARDSAHAIVSGAVPGGGWIGWRGEL